MGGVHSLWTDTFNAQIQTAESIRTDTPKAKIDFSAMPQEELAGFIQGQHGQRSLVQTVGR
jgi:hypothetical protein